MFSRFLHRNTLLHIWYFDVLLEPEHQFKFSFQLSTQPNLLHMFCDNIAIAYYSEATSKLAVTQSDPMYLYYQKH